MWLKLLKLSRRNHKEFAILLCFLFVLKFHGLLLKSFLCGLSSFLVLVKHPELNIFLPGLWDGSISICKNNNA